METNRSRLRAVLDTNIPIGALMSRNPNSPLVELLDRWLAAVREIYDETIRKYNLKRTERGWNWT